MILSRWQSRKVRSYFPLLSSNIYIAADKIKFFSTPCCIQCPDGKLYSAKRGFILGSNVQPHPYLPTDVEDPKLPPMSEANIFTLVGFLKSTDLLALRLATELCGDMARTGTNYLF